MSDAIQNDEAARHRAVLKVLSGIVICIFLAALDQTVVIPAIPAIAASLDDHRNLSWILTAYLLASTIAAPIYGRLSDHYGRRRLLEISLCIFIAASVICGSAGSISQLVLFRALQGIGGGGLMSLAQAAIADAVSPRERGRYQGYLAGVWAIASIAGPLVGGYLADHASWRWLFWINLPIGSVALLLCRRGLPATKDTHIGKAKFDVAGSAFMTVTVSALLLLLTLGGSTFPWASLQTCTLAGCVIVFGCLLKYQQARFKDGLFPPRLFVDRALVVANIGGMLSAGAMFASLFILPIFYQSVLHADATSSGLLMVPFLASSVVGNYITGHVARSYGRMRPVLLGGAAIAASGFLLLACFTGHIAFSTSAFFTICAGAGMGCANVSTLMIVQNSAQQRDIGAATGMYLLLRSIGSMLGGAAVGAFLDFQIRRSALSFSAASAGSKMHDTSSISGLPSETFNLAFAGMAALMLIGLVVCARAPDTTLRSARH
ncbi:EmrB/QacA family drug resistance transporter [Caballeronia calidae]|uniref:EmrB/QacA family drug resistance transporter n=1 Tax=Caballeronia calidae TaxID=1777139 RepID=A0A158EGY1_9BURK|nr:MDR family MFS transporter [Caballeronia calidae]SAL06088.1 EmrB/QacA family drug resistance transporter [Caballeronia calidae]